MDAIAEFGGERIEHFAPGAGERRRSRLAHAERARNGAADRAGGAGDQRRFSGEFEHLILAYIGNQ